MANEVHRDIIAATDTTVGRQHSTWVWNGLFSGTYQWECTCGKRGRNEKNRADANRFANNHRKQNGEQK